MFPDHQHDMFNTLAPDRQRQVLVDCLSAFPRRILPDTVTLFKAPGPSWFYAVDLPGVRITTPSFRVPDDLSIRDVIRTVFSLLFDLADEYDKRTEGMVKEVVGLTICNIDAISKVQIHE